MFKPNWYANFKLGRDIRKAIRNDPDAFTSSGYDRDGWMQLPKEVADYRVPEIPVAMRLGLGWVLSHHRANSLPKQRQNEADKIRDRFYSRKK